MNQRYNGCLAWVGLLLMLLPGLTQAGDIHAGPLLDRGPLTLKEGTREEWMGPFYYSLQSDTFSQTALPPFFSITKDPALEMKEWDFLYPVVTYDQFGPEHRLQFLQLLSFSGSKTQEGSTKDTFTLFPLYFHQKASGTNSGYTAVMPFYGHLQNRLFRDEVHFIMFPLYAQTRKKDVVTDNYLFPIVHTRHGNQLEGWQVWPLIGNEVKDPLTITNRFDEPELVPGHKKSFVLWPLYLDHHLNVGTTNPMHHLAVLPFFSAQRSPMRDSTMVPWPIGFSYTDEREKKYREFSAPWPFIVFARGEGKHVSRVFPLFSQAHNATLESNFYLWPIYKYNRLHSEPLDRERTRILFFLYSDVIERNLENSQSRRRTMFWPLFQHERGFDNNERLQLLTVLEPFLPGNKSIERNYSPVWSIWRSEKNAKTGAKSQSFLWNLYRCDSTPQTKKTSLLFGLFQYQKGLDGKKWRLFFIPLGKSRAGENKSSPQ